MNYNNRLSSTLANNIRLDSSKEYEAEKIAGGNIIWLVNRPAGVKIYVNSTPDRSGALVLNEANRGYKWEQLGNYGDLKLYDNFYLWTEGKNINGDLIELQVSPNADIITPILGNTADKIAAVESVDFIKNIIKVNEIDSFSDRALVQINNAIFNTYSKNKPIIEIFLTGEIEYSKTIMVAHLPIDSIASLGLKDDEYYRIHQVGHFDLGQKEEGVQGSTTVLTSHLCAFNNTNNATFTPETGQQFNKLYAVNKTPWANESVDLFDIWGIKYAARFIQSGNAMASILEDRGLNFHSSDFIIKGSLLNSYEKIGLFWNITAVGIAQSHSSILLTISKAYSNTLEG